MVEVGHDYVDGDARLRGGPGDCTDMVRKGDFYAVFVINDVELNGTNRTSRWTCMRCASFEHIVGNLRAVSQTEERT